MANDSQSRRQTSRSDPRDERIAELEAQLAHAQTVIGELEKQNAQLQERMAELVEQAAQLQQQVAELERAGKRQATPFAPACAGHADRRKKRKANPKKPGRKAGQGSFKHRAKPTPEEVDETKEAPLDSCPECGGELTQCKTHEQFMVDIPPVEPVITKFVTHSGYCGHCSKRTRSRHPEQISEATGAAGVVVGPRAKALAADMKHRLGISYGKVCELINDAFGLQVTRSGWCQADQRLAVQARPVYQELLDVLRASAVAHVDETGWRIGTLAAWLWVFTNREVTVYTIADNRSHEVVVEILGEAFEGILSSDCFTAYDHKNLADWLKQKCVSHLLKNLSDIEDQKTRGAVRFARQVTALLREALTLKKEKPNLAPATFSQQATDLEDRLDRLIDERRRFTDPDNKRFAKRLRKHRDHLLRFLYVDELDATNNLAERRLRPAVITRKTGGCNRTQDGADTHAVLSSVLVTCRQQSIPIVDYLIRLQQFGEDPPSLKPP
jgi:transposase